MTGIVLYAIGSPIVVDVEESLHRAGLALEAGIRNRPESVHLSDAARMREIADLDADLLRRAFLVPLFTPGHRQSAASEAARHGFTRPFTLVDPTTPAPRRLELGEGSYINAGCSLGGGSRFGVFAFVNRGASIGHHAAIGDFVSIGPGAVIAGQVAIGTGSVLGAGAVILPCVTVGTNAVIGGGAVVTRDVPDGCLVMGNPARIVRRDIGGYKGLTVPVSGNA